jgi:hypothetical protein
MKQLIATAVTAALLGMSGLAMADPEKDCLLEGTVYKSGQDQMGVKFHSARKYDKDANCRMRRGEKMEFKLPEDPRLEDAPAGSTVKYRYQEREDGSSKTELVSVGA